MREDRDVTVIETGSGSGMRWFLLGAALGAALGVLLAPERGEVTRREIARRGRRLREEAGEAFDELADEVETRGRALRDTVSEVAGEVREGRRQLTRDVASTRDRVRRRLADARSRARAAAGADDDDAGGDDIAE